MGSVSAIDSGIVDAFPTRQSGRGGVVGMCGLEVGVENISSKVVEGAKGSRLHQDNGGAGVCGRRSGASYGWCWTLRLHTGEERYSRRCRRCVRGLNFC